MRNRAASGCVSATGTSFDVNALLSQRAKSLSNARLVNSSSRENLADKVETAEKERE